MMASQHSALPQIDYRVLFESAPLACLVLLPDLTIIAASDAYLNATLTKREEVVGRWIFDVFPDSPHVPGILGSGQLRVSLSHVLATRRADKLELQRRAAQNPGAGINEERTWRFSNTPILDEAGQIKYIIHQLEDVTEFMYPSLPAPASTADTREQQLGKLTSELAAVNKELDAFAYSISHDLRAPLRAIDGFSNLLVEDAGDNLPEDAQHDLKRIRINVQIMQSMIEDLLSLARLGRQMLSKQPVDPVVLVQEVLVELRNEYAGRDIEFRVGDLPASEADPLLVKRVFLNLISNALKFSRNRDHAIIEIGSQPEGALPIYFVRDNGVGFDMQYANKLFGAFQRLHSSDEFEGTGIGLAIVRRIITRHGGRIWIEAAVDKGATFFFTLG